MTKVILLEQLKIFTEDATGDLLLPVARQKGDSGPPAPRAAEVYRARLPDSTAAKKKAPYRNGGCYGPDNLLRLSPG